MRHYRFLHYFLFIKVRFFIKLTCQDDKCVKLKNYKEIQGFGTKETFKTQLPFPIFEDSLEDSTNLLNFIGSISSQSLSPKYFKKTKNQDMLFLRFKGFIPPHIISKILDLILYVYF